MARQTRLYSQLQEEAEEQYIRLKQISVSEEDWRECRAGVFFPMHPWKEAWDTLILPLVLYAAVFVPFHLSFHSEASAALSNLKPCDPPRVAWQRPSRRLRPHRRAGRVGLASAPL